MILHKVDDSSKGIHEIVFKIKQTVDSNKNTKENVTCAKTGHPSCPQNRIKNCKKKKKKKRKVNIKSFSLGSEGGLNFLFRCLFSLRWTITLNHSRGHDMFRHIFISVLNINHLITLVVGGQ